MIAAFYKQLYQHFGPQGWWPTTPTGDILPRYSPKKSLLRQSEQDMFEVCVGAFLTQNTSWSNVEKALATLSQKRCLSYKSLLGMKRPHLEKLIRSCGYYRQKSGRLIDFLIHVKNVSAGSFRAFFSGPLASVRHRLLKIKGIGPETADSMLLYAAGKPIFVVDAYTRRLGTRWGILTGQETYSEIQQLFMSALPRSASIYGEYHALLVKCAKDFCRSHPRCGQCPLKKKCKTGKKGNQKHAQ